MFNLFLLFLSSPPTNPLFKSPALTWNVSLRRVSPLTLCPWVLVQVLRVSPCAEARASTLPSPSLPSAPATVFLPSAPIPVLSLPEETASAGYTVDRLRQHVRFPSSPLPLTDARRLDTGAPHALQGLSHWAPSRLTDSPLELSQLRFFIPSMPITS